MLIFKKKKKKKAAGKDKDLLYTVERKKTPPKPHTPPHQYIYLNLLYFFKNESRPFLYVTAW